MAKPNIEFRVLAGPIQSRIFAKGSEHPLAAETGLVLVAAGGNRGIVRIIDREMGESFEIGPGQAVQPRGTGSQLEILGGEGRNVLMLRNYGEVRDMTELRAIPSEHAIEGAAGLRGRRIRSAGGLRGRRIRIPCGSDVSVR
jgi:hypothetical protein